MPDLSTFNSPLRVAIIGATGGIGQALANHLRQNENVERLYILGRTNPGFQDRKCRYISLDLTKEDTIKTAADSIQDDGALDIVLVATGFLHSSEHQPEKSYRHINREAFEKSFSVNSFGPALVGKHFIPLLHKDRKAVFAALSARVGSISDNRLGGWYAYRAAKAALNMLLKCLAIEFGRKSKTLIVLGLHPGTVDTSLSKPFQSNVPDGKLFTPDYSAQRLLSVINDATPDDTGNLLAWDGQTIPF